MLLKHLKIMWTSFKSMCGIKNTSYMYVIVEWADDMRTAILDHLHSCGFAVKQWSAYRLNFIFSLDKCPHFLLAGNIFQKCDIVVVKNGYTWCWHIFIHVEQVV